MMSAGAQLGLSHKGGEREKGPSSCNSEGQRVSGVTLSFSWELRSSRTCRYWNWRDGRLKIRSRRVDMPR